MRPRRSPLQASRRSPTTQGQRLSITYANGVSTTYTYDAATFRLNGLLTLRPSGASSTATKRVQDLAYTYDAAGNVIHIEELRLSRRCTFANVVVGPSATMVYDSTYR